MRWTFLARIHRWHSWEIELTTRTSLSEQAVRALGTGSSCMRSAPMEAAAWEDSSLGSRRTEQLLSISEGTLGGTKERYHLVPMILSLTCRVRGSRRLTRLAKLTQGRSSWVQSQSNSPLEQFVIQGLKHVQPELLSFAFRSLMASFMYPLGWVVVPRYLIKHW